MIDSSVKKYHVILLLVLCCSFTRSQEYCYDIRNMKYEPHHFVDTIPLRCQDNRIYVTLEIGGRKHEFLLDTGASLGDLYEGSGIEAKEMLGEIRSVTDVTGVDQSGQIVSLPDFRIGKLLVNNYPIQLSPKKARDKVHGTIGFALFNKGISAKIDAQNRILVLTDIKGYFKKEGGFVLDYSLCRFTPQVTLGIADGWDEPAVFDTGNPQFFFMGVERWKELCSYHNNAHSFILGQMKGIGIKGVHNVHTRDSIFFLQLPSLSWGTRKFSNVLTHTKSGISNLGAALLNYGTVTIDPYKKRLVFQANHVNGTISPEASIRDVYFTRDDKDRPAVGFVTPKSELYQYGFRDGDVVLSINRDIINNFAEFEKYLFVIGNRYTFKLKHPKGFIHEVSIIYRKGLIK